MTSDEAKRPWMDEGGSVPLGQFPGRGQQVGTSTASTSGIWEMAVSVLKGD